MWIERAKIVTMTQKSPLRAAQSQASSPIQPGLFPHATAHTTVRTTTTPTHANPATYHDILGDNPGNHSPFSRQNNLTPSVHPGSPCLAASSDYSRHQQFESARHSDIAIGTTVQRVPPTDITIGTTVPTVCLPNSVLSAAPSSLPPSLSSSSIQSSQLSFTPHHSSHPFGSHSFPNTAAVQPTRLAPWSASAMTPGRVESSSGINSPNEPESTSPYMHTVIDTLNSHHIDNYNSNDNDNIIIHNRNSRRTLSDLNRIQDSRFDLTDANQVTSAHTKLPGFSEITSQLLHHSSGGDDFRSMSFTSDLGSSIGSANTSRTSSCSSDLDLELQTADRDLYEDEDGHALTELGLAFVYTDEDLDSLSYLYSADVCAAADLPPVTKVEPMDICSGNPEFMNSDLAFWSSNTIADMTDPGYDSSYEQQQQQQQSCSGPSLVSHGYYGNGEAPLLPLESYHDLQPYPPSGAQPLSGPTGPPALVAYNVQSSPAYSDEGFVDEPTAGTGPENLPNFDKIQFTSPGEVEKPAESLRRNSSSPKEKRRAAGSPQMTEKERRKPGRKPGQVSNVLHLWEFMRDLLHSPDTQGIIEWISKPDGVFRVVNSSEVAKLWGKKKKNKKEMTYEKLSRSLRYSRLEGYFANLPKDKNYPKKLCFKFGPKSKDWY